MLIMNTTQTKDLKMVSITAEITVKEISEELGIFDNLSKVLVQRMFGMNYFRPFPSEYAFFIQAYNIPGRVIYASDTRPMIGLRPGETDGTKAAVLAYIKKAAPSHIDMTDFATKAP